MNINNIYASRYLIPEEYHEKFEANQKHHLNHIELLGLEAVLVAFIQQFEEEAYGEVYSKNIADFTRYNEDNVDILDGCYDTYIFDNYAVSDIWMTDNGIPMLSCYRLEHDEYDDPFEIAQNIDWMTECEYVLFRLG